MTETWGDRGAGAFQISMRDYTPSPEDVRRACVPVSELSASVTALRSAQHVLRLTPGVPVYDPPMRVENMLLSEDNVEWRMDIHVGEPKQESIVPWWFAVRVEAQSGAVLGIRECCSAYSVTVPVPEQEEAQALSA